VIPVLFFLLQHRAEMFLGSTQVYGGGCSATWLEFKRLAVPAVFQGTCRINEQLLYLGHTTIVGIYPEEVLLHHHREMRVTMDVQIAISNGCHICENICLAAFASATTGTTMSAINGVANLPV
jgi:hypothetical protein